SNNAIASCMAMRVPDPSEKCTVLNASPSSTTFLYDQFSLLTMFAENQIERFDNKPLLPKSLANTFSQKRWLSSSDIASRPARFHVSGSTSIRKVLKSLLY